MTKKHFDVFVVGDYCLDFIFTGLQSEPVLGKEIIGSGFTMTPGGTCNSVIALHRLGINVGWAADFGNDIFSKWILEILKKEGLHDGLFVQHDSSLQFVTVSLSYPKDRAFIAYYDKGPTFPAALKALPKITADIGYIPGLLHGPKFKMLHELIKPNISQLMMDGNYPEWLTYKSKGVEFAINHVDIFSCNADEAFRLTGEKKIEKAIITLSKLCPTVLVKAGSKGAYGFSNQQLEFVPSLKIKALDSTGAGDCFNAGFISAWRQNKSLRICLQYANIVGGLSTLKRGGTEFIVTQKNIEKMIKKYREEK